jgi:hypothetical protein
MIDVVVNKEGMLSIVHDNPRLDNIVEVEFVDKDSTIILVESNGAKHVLGRMTDYLRELFQGKEGYIVRMDGWVVADTRKLPVRVV